MNKILAALVTIIFLGSSTAQNFIGKINPFPPEKPRAVSQNDTLRVLAVMVEFQEDKDDATFGNGKFGSVYSKDYGTEILDPLPHDAAYFQDHLLFVKNYFSKVSKDNLTVDYALFPGIVTVSKTMRSYSPPSGSDDLGPLGQFSEEVWRLAGLSDPAFDFGRFEMFIIFHAGVGRDVNLPGSIGIERDLPSVYLGFEALKEIFGQNFNGFQVNNNLIKNTAILPSTESREISVIGGSVLLELTTNGLIAASVGSHLGLPDLFDTETGLSAIGRFGLMDGQSIFAYSGTFPPEPSPWEKEYLGWTSSGLVTSNGRISVSTSLAAGSSDTALVRIPINSDEYYLLENRARDSRKDGAIITYKVNGSLRTAVFPKDTAGFRSFEVDSLKGVVVDVDEFDWAVPGNGVVIWHIDDGIIRNKIASNSINNDKFNRGVDVEEADGIQDIGEEFFTIFGDVVIGEGTQEDFWFASNNSTLYKNRFDRNSSPNTLSNYGANSLISLSDFTDTANVVSFTVTFGDGEVKLIKNYPLNISESINSVASLKKDTGIFYYFNSDTSGRLYKYNAEGQLVKSLVFSARKIAPFHENNVEYLFGTKDSGLNIYATDGTAETENKFDHQRPFSTPPVIHDVLNDYFEILAGTDSGELIKISVDKFPSLNIRQSSVVSTLPYGKVTKIASDGQYFVFAAGDRIYDANGGTYTLGGALVDLNLTRDITGNPVVVCLLENNMFSVLTNGVIGNTFKANSASRITSFSLADIFNDGSNYILINAGNTILAYNLTGALAENFPYTASDGTEFQFMPLASDLNGDGMAEIISVTKDGRVMAVSTRDASDYGVFPIAFGNNPAAVPLIHNSGQTRFSVLNANNEFFVYDISGTESALFYPEEFGGSLNRSFVDPADDGRKINDFFPEDRVYNWPNPVYGDETYIRFYISEESNYEIKVFDLAGDLVSEMTGSARGGLDNEVAWDVSNVQSGVYFARVNVESMTGNSSEKIIKIAVIK